MKTIVKYDLMYFFKTHKHIVLGALAVFLSGLVVVSARYYNTLIEWALRSEGIEDVSLPVATVSEAYVQFYSQYQQIFALVIFFVAVAFFTHDKSRGHYPWLFAHPISRLRFLLSKSLVMIGFLTASLVVGSLVFGYYTFVIFNSFDFLYFFISLGVFWLQLVLMIQVIQLFVVIFEQYLVPLILSIAVYFVLGALSILSASVFMYLPNQLMALPIEIMTEGLEALQVMIVSLTTVALILIVSYVSYSVFKHKTLA